MDDNTLWEELTTKIFRIYQQLQPENQSIQITMTTREICISRQEQPKEQGTINQTIALQVINQHKDNEIIQDWKNGNVYDEIRHYWQKINSQPRRKRTKTLANHFAIGASLFRHNQRLKEVELLWNDEPLEILQEITQLRCVKTLHKICSRLYDLFENCSQVIVHLEDHLTITQIGRMKQSAFNEFKRKIQESLEPNFAVAQS